MSVISLVAAGVSIPVHAQQTDEIVEFDIPAQKLSNALKSYGVAADRQVLFAANLVRGKQANAVSGELQPNIALDQLLMGSGLAYETTASDVVVIKTVPQDASAGQTLGAVSVEEDDAVSITASEGGGGVLPELEEIIVTGTNIRGVENSASPVLRFDQEMIDRSGLSTVVDFVQRAVPQNFAAGAAEDTFSTVRAGAELNQGEGAGVNLRGLGTDSTLVLINGKRLAPSGFGSFVDISQIPLNAIERIEILTDGASAVYGSDAIGGVVNFILRDDYEGAETRLRYGAVTDGGLNEYQVGQSLGANWESGGALVSYEYYNRGALDSADRFVTQDASDPFDVLPEQERNSVFFSGNQELGSSAELYVTALYTNRDSLRRATSLFVFPPSQVRDGEEEQLSVTFGSRLEWGQDWAGDLSGTFSQADTLNNTINLDGSGSGDAFLQTGFESRVIDGKLDGPVAELPGGTARLAIGGQYRSEDLKFESTSSVFRASDRDVYAAFGELFVPIIGESNRRSGAERLELTVAGRFEEYSDFGSSTDPKFGLLYSPVEGLNIRGTWSTAFRAPLLNELDDLQGAIILFDLVDPTSATGFSEAAVRIGNNADLLPEESENWTFGLDFNPAFAPALQLGFTYFDIEITNRIVAPTAAQQDAALSDPALSAIADRLFDPAFLNQIISIAQADNQFFDATAAQLGAAGVDAIVDGRIQNLSVSSISGIDFDLVYSAETDFGQLGFTFGGTYFTNFDEQFTEDSPTVDILGQVFQPPELRFRIGANWSRSGLSASAFVNYVDDLTDERVDPAIDIGAFTTVDFQITANLGELIAPSFLEGTSAHVSIVNAFDELPPLVDVPFFGLNFDSENHDVLGRFIAIGITHQW